jgi:UDP-N-acetylglucosamine transferase subunit ALG13
MHLLEMGLFPVVVPRRAKRNEHVDDHQAQIAGLLSSRAISMVTEADELDRNTIVAASAASVRSTAGLTTLWRPLIVVPIAHGERPTSALGDGR